MKYSGNLRAIYEYGKSGILNSAESRIHHLYQFLDKDIMPWMWDHENYSLGNEDMIGFFYPEDIENIKQIDDYVNEFKLKEMKKMQSNSNKNK